MSGRRYRLNSVATAGLVVLLGAAPAVGQTEREVEDVFWQSVVCERELEVRAYLEAYPDGVYVSEAWACLEQGLGLTRLERVAVQRGLAEVGQEPGPADGLFGGPETKTRRAIRAWQAAKGMAATGYLSREQADILIVTGQAVEERQQAAAERAAREERQAAADDTAYAAAAEANTAEAYGEYLEAYPAGRHADAARERRAERQAAAEQAAREEAARQAAAADDAAYAAAEGADTAAAYGEYLEAYPAGRHAAAAREAREVARRAAAQRRARDAQLRVGQTFRDDLRAGGAGPEMVVVPAGAFWMGCVSGQNCQDDEYPVHKVTIGAPFAVGVYEVTFAEWDRCVRAEGCGGYRPDDKGWGRGKRPVIHVSWKDARAYVAWLSGESGARYRLLSEAEWEYVARAGSETAYSWGDEIGKNRANCEECGSRWDGKQTAPVGSFAANAFGLHDVHGNVREWVQDCPNRTYAGAPADGSAWEQAYCNDDRDRVVRGGSWSSYPWYTGTSGIFAFPGYLRSANRSSYSPGNRYTDVGFRVARSLTHSAPSQGWWNIY